MAELVRRRWWRWRKPRLRGCAIVARNHAGEVLMVRHSYRKRDEWHVPTGGVRDGEDAEVAARRELAEEVGVTVATITLVHVEEIDLHGATNLVSVFAATFSGTPVPDDREIAEIAFFAADDLPATTPEWARKYVAKAVTR
ncbi:NUDIX domain-containing protein [Croceicoccus sediminis]|uniref:NUDIX domain-containing protein n=1 Tax=Croceicoccus sediminis TaxID=2571150 RepID=UPI001183655A|nr:NUDIX domain-containing protein [Croceicoccus sediminis]